MNVYACAFHECLCTKKIQILVVTELESGIKKAKYRSNFEIAQNSKQKQELVHW